MMDIMCMISIFKDHPFVFVGKIEPKIEILLDSVAPDVKKISFGEQ